MPVGRESRMGKRVAESEALVGAAAGGCWGGSGVGWGALRRFINSPFVRLMKRRYACPDGLSTVDLLELGDVDKADSKFFLWNQIGDMHREMIFVDFGDWTIPAKAHE
jgi:hypothetical protein